MKNTEINVPYVSAINDLTIIYKGTEEREGQLFEQIEEIKTSKEEFLRKLRYFKQKSNEINEQKEIYIHDVFPIKIFKEFISTLTTDKIILNDDNYLVIKKLSRKYEYNELYQAAEKFSLERPDIGQILDEYSNKEIDEEKEEQIVSHLDIALQNVSMLDLPIEKLNRILNSPKRILKNHHLLFNFIKKVIEKQKSKKYSNDDIETKERDIENLQILISSLDYTLMSKEEMIEVFDSENFSSVFDCRGTKKMMNTFIKEIDRKEEQMKKLETQIGQLENVIKKEFEKYENLNLKKEKEMNETMNKYKEELKKQQECIENQEIRINELVESIKINENKFKGQVQKQNKIIELHENKIKQLEEECRRTSSNEQEKQQNFIDLQTKKLNDLDSKISQIMKNNKLKGSININVQQDQSIKGYIEIKEKGTQLDKKRSKYLLNTNKAEKLGSKSYNNGIAIENLKQEVSYWKPAGTYYLHALLVDSFGNENEIVSKSVTSKGAELNYHFTGKVETAILDAGTYKLEVWGAEGGKNQKFYTTSGKGGYSVGVLTLQKKTKLFIHVGESPSGGKGGWNGGGSATKFVDNTLAAGGGGSTDISLYGEEKTDNWNNENHLYSRIIVAGAGGGSSHNGLMDWYGGFGGGISGQCSGHPSAENEGTQTRAGTCNKFSKGQGFGVGGTHTGEGSSGGGGGWYGGGASDESSNAAGGSGGSGYVYNSSTAMNYPKGCKLNSSFYLTNSKTESGDQQIPNPLDSSTEKGHSGHGFARITFQ